jgi:hypothetical protein
MRDMIEYPVFGCPERQRAYRLGGAPSTAWARTKALATTVAGVRCYGFEPTRGMSMRSLLALLGIAVLVVAGLIYFGIIRIDQTQPGVVQAPRFQADVARVSVGTENKTVAVPTIDVQKPGETPAPAQ